MYQTNFPKDATPEGDELLMQLAANLTAGHGLSGVTVREVSKQAGLSPSGFLYRFSSRDGFLQQLFEWASERDRIAWEERTRGLLLPGLQQEDLPGLTRAIISTHGLRQRQNVILMWELYLLSRQQPDLRPILISWRQHDQAFWKQCFETVGLPCDLAPGWAAAVLSLQRIPLLSGRLEICLGWIDDAIDRLFERLTNRSHSKSGDSTWRKSAELAFDPAPLSATTDDSTPQRIINAASEIILETGCASLSHRAIANRVGVSLSSTTHHFKSLEDILIHAFRKIYADARKRAEALPKSRPHYTGEQFYKEVMPSLTGMQRSEYTAAVAMEDIILTASRRPELQDMALALYALMGSTTTHLLNAITDAKSGFDRLDAHIYRLFLTGLMCGSTEADLSSDNEQLQRISAAFIG